MDHVLEMVTVIMDCNVLLMGSPSVHARLGLMNRMLPSRSHALASPVEEDLSASKIILARNAQYQHFTKGHLA